MPENNSQHNESPNLSPQGKTQDTDTGNVKGNAAFRIPGVYLLAFVLLLLLDAGRAAPMLERQGAELDMPFLRVAGQTLRQASESSGLAALTRFEGQVLASLSPNLTLGAVAAQGRETSTVDAALDDLRRSVENESGRAGPEAVASENNGPQGPAPVQSPAPVLNQNAAQEAGAVSSPDTELVGETGTGAGGGQPGRKPRVLLIGDSMMMEGFGPVLQRMLRARPDLEVIREGKYSTGLSRVDYFDWGTYLRELIARDTPDMVVICLGANDPQDIIDENGKRHIADSPSWREIYQARAQALLRAATEAGARALWVGLPIMSKEPYSTRIRHLSDLQKAACTTYMAPGEPGRARFVDTVSALADAKGEYAAFAADATGQPVRLRYKDKVHVTEEGGRRLSERVIPFILADLGLPEKVLPAAAGSGTKTVPGAGAAQTVPPAQDSVKAPVKSPAKAPVKTPAKSPGTSGTAPVSASKATGAAQKNASGR